jgi:hypothetical protein
MATKSLGTNNHPNHHRIPPETTLEKSKVSLGKKNIAIMNNHP